MVAIPLEIYGRSGCIFVFGRPVPPTHLDRWQHDEWSRMDRCRHLSTGKTWATIFRSDSFSKGRERRDERTGLARGGWRERKGTNRYHFGVIGTGRGINVLNPLFVLHCIYDDNCKYIDDTSTSAPPEALLLRNLYYNRYTSRVSLYYSEKGRERE